MIARALAATVGALAAAVGAAACCAPPFLVGLLGLSSAGLGGAIQPYRPVFLSASGAFFLVGLLWVRRREDASCDCGDATGAAAEGADGAAEPGRDGASAGPDCSACASAGTARRILWAALLASAALAFYPEWTAWL